MNYCTHDDGRTLVTRDGLGKCPLCVALEDLANLRVSAENERMDEYNSYLMETSVQGEKIEQLQARIIELEIDLTQSALQIRTLEAQQRNLKAENDRKRRELTHAYRRIKALDKWPAEMVKVNGLGDKQTPEECGDFIADLTNSFVEIKAENTKLSAEWQQVHDWNNELVGQHYKLGSKIRQLQMINDTFNQQLSKLEHALSDTKSTIEALELEVKADDAMLLEHFRLLKAIPECFLHGPCVPHAIEWVQKAKGFEAENKQLKATLIEECRKTDNPCFCGVHDRRV